MDSGDSDIALRMAENDRAQHDLFRQLLRFRLHHENGRLCSCNDQIHDRIFAGCLARVQHVFAVYITHAGCTNRAVKRNAADGQGRAHRNHGGDVCIHFGVQRDGVNHHVNFIKEAFGEQGANRAINQAAGQRFKFARTAFALEKATGDFSSGVAFLKVINSQREKILSGFAFGLADHGRQNDGSIHIEQHCSGGLASDFAGFHGHGVVAPLEGLANFFKHCHGLSPRSTGGAGHLTQARIQRHSPRCHSRATGSQMALE